MTKVNIPLTTLLVVVSCVSCENFDEASFRVDDECRDVGGSTAKDCTIELLQNREHTRLLAVNGSMAVSTWTELIEGTECPSTGEITCLRIGIWRHFKFPAGEFVVSRQVSIPEHTIIEGIANPNGEDRTKKPDYRNQTLFVASEGVSDPNACYCQNLKRSWLPQSPSNPHHCLDLTIEQVRSLRKGFLMFANTVVKNIAFQGKDTLRPTDNGDLCGGGVFETPGCVHNRCEFPHLVTGDGKPVRNVSIENVRLNDFSDDPTLASQLAVWVAQTTDTDTPTSDVHVENLVAMFLHADGINFHGFVQNALVDGCYIQNTGDDIYAVWGSHFDTKGIVFQNSVAVDAGRARDNHYGSCVAVYGAREATFRNLTCYAPEQNTRDCYDMRHGGETCNGCLGIVKESFSADYSGSVLTFTDNKFYDLKREEKLGRQIYDLTSPQASQRPMVCNNEWKKGGLTVIVDSAGEDSTTYTSLGGVAVNEGNGVGMAKHNCDLLCCESYCTQEAECNSFAWSAEYRMCYLKDAILQQGSAVHTGRSFTTYIKHR